MNPTGSMALRFKNVTEVSSSWTLNNNSTPTTTPYRIQSMHDSWMPPPSTHELQEAIWNAYTHKKLIKYTWKMTNFRFLIETRTTMPAVGSAPPVTDVQLSEPKEWVLWYWRQQTESDTTPPAANDESRYTKFCIKDCKSHIWGKFPTSYRRMNYVNDSYNTCFNSVTGTYANLDTYLNSVANVSYGLPQGVSNMPNPDVHIMPDDPYPTGVYSESGVTRAVQMTVMFDVYSYTTWSLIKPVTH